MDYSKKIEELYAKCSDRLRAHVKSRMSFAVSPNEEAGDVVNEAFLLYAQQLQKNEPEKPKAYLYTIANNLLRKHRRQTGLQYSTEAINENTVLPEPGPDETLAAKQELSKLVSALQGLSEKQRTIFIMRRVHGMSHEEISERYGISKVAVERHITRAFKHCREKLNRGSNARS